MKRYTLADMVSLVKTLVKPVTEFLAVEFGKKTITVVAAANVVSVVIETVAVPAIPTIPQEEIKVMQELPSSMILPIVIPESIEIKEGTLYNSDDLTKLTVKRLKEICKQLDLVPSAKMKKADIITYIKVTQPFPILVY